MSSIVFMSTTIDGFPALNSFQMDDEDSEEANVTSRQGAETVNATHTGLSIFSIQFEHVKVYIIVVIMLLITVAVKIVYKGVPGHQNTTESA